MKQLVNYYFEIKYSPEDFDWSWVGVGCKRKYTAELASKPKEYSAAFWI